MKIQNLRLVDFTRYEDAEVHLEETINIIVGSNAAGKTSLVDAITYCLTGACDRTDRAGRGAEAMIRAGAREAFANLSIISNGQPFNISRSVPGGLRIDNHNGGQKELQDLLCEELGAGTGAITAALNTHAFLGLKPDEQKSLLFGLLGLDLGPNDVLDMLGTEALKTVEEDAVARALGAVPQKLLAGGPADIFANLYKHFYDLRRDYKRRLADLGAPPQPTLVKDLPDREETKARLEGYRELLADVRRQRTEATEIERQVGALDEEIDALKLELERAVDTREAEAQLEHVREEIRKYEAASKEALDKAAGLKAAVDALTAAGAKRECPLAPGIVTCPLTKPKRQELVDKLTAEVNALSASSADAMAAADLLAPRMAELKELAAAPDRPRLEGMISERESRLAALRANEIPQAQSDVDVATMLKEIADLEEQLEEISREEGARSVLKAQATERDRLACAIEALEVLVKLTGPKGLPGRLLAETIEPVAALANERLLQLTGGCYELEITAEPAFAISVRHDGGEIDLGRLSSSEKMRIGIILQDAISRLSGLRVMVIDEADLLDQENRQLLTGMLLTIAGDYDTIIVLSTGLPEDTTDPGIDGVAVYAIRDGQVARVGTREEALVT